MRLPAFIAAAIVSIALASPATVLAAVPWPPREGPGTLFVHFGEEHWNDDDGMTLLPKVVEDTARYRPALVTMSGDKANDGNVEELSKWLEIMGAYDRAGVPYLAGVGNHDRKAPPGVPGGVSPTSDIGNYKTVFAGRPYPMGDAKPYSDPLLSPRERPASDPAGASSHYFVDAGPVRWIFIDNSCWGIQNCDPLQSPSFPDADGFDSQYDFLRARAKEAGDAGRLVFVVMHMPTRDPRDQTYIDPTSSNHVMGKGTSPDNMELEAIAEEVGIDAFFAAHIKGQFVYRGQGNIPYYIDGGAGGELYTEGPVGTDHGYWHGYRLIRVSAGRVTTDTVPIFVPGGITVRGPVRLAPGSKATWEAFGKQPVFKDPAKVEALELRDPAPVPRSSGGGMAVMPVVRWLLPFALLLLVVPLLSRRGERRARPRLAPGPAAIALALLSLPALAAISLAQQSAPTSTPKESLPIPARIWTSSNPLVLEPAPSADDDARRDRRTQTDSGTFQARCPGRARLEIASGWESRATRVTVPSRPGRIVRSIRVKRRSMRAGRSTALAHVSLAQPAEVLARVRRGRRRVATVRHVCFNGGAKPLAVRWNGRSGSRKAAPGRYWLEVLVRSDRRTVVRRATIRVRR